MRALVLVVLALYAVSIVAQDQGEVQAVLQLLEDLKTNVVKETNALDEAWGQRQKRKQSVIDSLSESAQEQRFECQNKDNDVASKTKDIDNTNSFVAWMQGRQQSNTKRIQILEQNRCDQSNNYINDVKNDKVALALVLFLKKELSRDEKSTWANRVNKFVEVYTSGRLLSMVQVKADPAGETVIPFSDDDSDEETLLILEGDAEIIVDPIEEDQDGRRPPPQAGGSDDEIPTPKSEIFQILDELEAFIRKHLAQSQDNEVNSALTFIDFKIAIEKENATFDKHTHDEQDNLVRLNNQLTNRVQAANLCKSRLQQITTAFTVAQQDFDASKQNYLDTRKSKEEETTVFEEVYRIYVNQVVNDKSFVELGSTEGVRINLADKLMEMF